MGNPMQRTGHQDVDRVTRSIREWTGCCISAHMFRILGARGNGLLTVFTIIMLCFFSHLLESYKNVNDLTLSLKYIYVMILRFFGVFGKSANLTGNQASFTLERTRGHKSYLVSSLVN